MRSGSESQAGFTLLEVLVVVVVVGIISSIGIISLMGALDRSKQRATMSDMRTISRAFEAYSVDNGMLPGDSGGLTALGAVMIPYATNVLPTKDHWDNLYDYTRNGTSYSLISFGKDGLDSADLTPGANFDYDSDIVVFNGVFVGSAE